MSGLNERWHDVWLANDHVGSLLQRGDFTRFLFDDDYWDRSNRGVLGLWFENQPGVSPQSSLRLPVWFSNLLPEGRLLNWIADDRGVSPQREMELLLRIGHDLPGAVVVSEEGEARPGDWRSDIPNSSSDGSDHHAFSFSLAGMVMKLSMIEKGDRLVLPVNGDLGDWIVKPPSRSFANLPANEDAMMTLAQLCGLEVPEHRLVHRDEVDGVPQGIWPTKESYAYAVRRFDREDGRRIHIEDFAQVRNRYPSPSLAKYEGSFESVGAICYRQHDVWSLQEWARRIAFNLAIGNGDAHLKNWSLIYPDGRRPRLSPVYDLVRTVDKVEGENFGLKFTGTRQFDRIKSGGFEALEKRLEAHGAGLEEEAAKVVCSVVDHIPRVADNYPEISSLLEAIRENSKTLQALLRF